MSGVLIAIALIILFLAAWRFNAGLKKNMYQYGNIRRLGILIFLSVFLIWEGITYIGDIQMGYPPSLFMMVFDIKESVALFMLYMFPVALVTSVLVTISNINLLRREGLTWKNMLGLLLGGFICISSLIVCFALNYLKYSQDFIVMLIEYLLYLYALFIAYLECILAGTVIMGIIAAKHNPCYDKDYIIVPGCQIRKDGSLTPLLKARVDRALEFAGRQTEKTGKAPVFVTSGGQGPDEIISEAEAMKKYLIDSGIEESRIIAESKSVSTEENIRFSTDLIKQEKEDAKIAFSTTNYHVFRTGNIAYEMGLSMEGMGAGTKAYFWINAFIREFIATLVKEKKHHTLTLFIFAVLLFAMHLYLY